MKRVRRTILARATEKFWRYKKRERFNAFMSCARNPHSPHIKLKAIGLRDGLDHRRLPWDVYSAEYPGPQWFMPTNDTGKWHHTLATSVRYGEF